MMSNGAAGERPSGGSFGPQPPGTAPMAANSSSGPVSQGRGSATGVVVQPRAREAFIPREIAEAYKEFTNHGPQHRDAETGLGVSVYRFGERVLIVYEESETGLVVLTHRSAWKVNSRKAISAILHRTCERLRKQFFATSPKPRADHKI